MQIREWNLRWKVFSIENRVLHRVTSDSSQTRGRIGLDQRGLEGGGRHSEHPRIGLRCIFERRIDERLRCGVAATHLRVRRAQTEEHGADSLVRKHRYHRPVRCQVSQTRKRKWNKNAGVVGSYSWQSFQQTQKHRALCRVGKIDIWQYCESSVLVVSLRLAEDRRSVINADRQIHSFITNCTSQRRCPVHCLVFIAYRRKAQCGYGD